MKKELFIYALFVLLTSCFGNITPKISNEERKAVQDLVNFYGGNFDYGTYFQILSDGSKHYYFGLKLSDSPIIGDSETDNILAAGIAYRFYFSLKREANAFDQIRTEIVDSNGGSKKYTYDIAELKKVKSEIPKTSKVLDLLKKQDYNGAVSQCDTSWIEDKNTAIESLKKAEKKYGILTDFQVYGFEFYKNTKGQTNLSICGIAISTKENHRLKIVTDPNDTALKIELFLYKF
jgi:hypothetical protein